MGRSMADFCTGGVYMLLDFCKDSRYMYVGVIPGY